MNLTCNALRSVIKIQCLQYQQYIRYFSSSSKKREKFLERERSQQEKYQRIHGTAEEQPEFSQLIKSFYKKCHPDIIRHTSTEHAEWNDVSFQQLNEVLSTIKNNEYPNLMNKSITFYLRKSPPTSSDTTNNNHDKAVTSSIATNNHPIVNSSKLPPIRDDFEQVSLTLITAGGDSRKALFKSFQTFFYQSNILNASKDERFQWGKDYFRVNTLKEDYNSYNQQS